MKTAIYAVVVCCFLLAGTMDLCQRQWKLGIVAFLFAATNSVVFLWR